MLGNPNTDAAVKLLYDQLYGLEQAAILAPTDGIGVAAGQTKVTGSRKLVATGLDSVQYAVVSIQSDVAINEWTTLTVDRDALNIFVWKPTGVADTTPIASTTERVVHWFAWGAL